MIKHHGQDNLEKKDGICAYGVRVRMHNDRDPMAAGSWHGSRQEELGAKKCHLEVQARSREKVLGIARGFETSNSSHLAPAGWTFSARPLLLSFPKQHHQDGPMYSMGDISLQPTVEGAWLAVSI